MMKRLACLLLFLATSSFASQTCSPDVMQLFPGWMAVTRVRVGVCQAVVGTPITFAAFSNGVGGVAMTMAPDSSTGQLKRVSDSSVSFNGQPLSVDVVHLFNDGSAQAIVRTMPRQALTSWVYLIGPDGVLKALGPDDGFVNAMFIDLDADGTSELITQSFRYVTGDGSEEPTAEPEWELFRYTGAEFKSDTSRLLLAVQQCERTTAKPEIFATRFTLDSPGTGRLLLVNGDRDEKTRCTSGRVALNDTPVVQDSDFKKAAAIIERDVPLGVRNVLSVELAGAPGCKVTVLVDRAAK